MPQPHPGQDWRHGWIPLNAGAAKSKNHGRKPGGGSLISRMVSEAADIHKRQQAQDADRKSREADTPKTPTAKKPARQTAKSKTAGKKVGADSRNAPLREGDQVSITEGRHKGKIATVTGKGKHGAIQVDVGGERVDVSPANVRSRADQDTSRQADAAIRKATGRAAADQPPAGRASTAEIQNQIEDAYHELAAEPMAWVSLTRLRKKLDAKLPRAQVDDALRKLERQPNVNLVPESNQKTLTAADRAAAVHIGDQDKHLILFSSKPRR
jgi:hypothetical protein